MCLGIPGKVVRIWDDRGTLMADVDFGGATKDVCLAYLPDLSVGDYTIVHAGFALTQLDEESALASLTAFRELGMLEAELGLSFPDEADEGAQQGQTPGRAAPVPREPQRHETPKEARPS